jgi:hypothetical protein
MAKFGFWRREDMLSIRKILMLVLVLVAPLANAAYESSGSIYNFNGNDLSIYQETINASQGDEIILEVTADNFNSYLMVFFNGALIGSDNNSGVGENSLLSFNATLAGEYLFTVGQNLYSESEALAGVQHNTGFLDTTWSGAEEGTFVISIAGVTEVPVPAALPMFLSALFGLGFLRRKR